MKKDTLTDIAVRFGVMLLDLKRTNNILGNTIYPGQAHAILVKVNRHFSY